MTTDELEEFLGKEGYFCLRRFPDGTFAGIRGMVVTCGLFVGLSERGYERRYCYEHAWAAMQAIALWDGAGDPPGDWIKEKPSNRLGPGATGVTYG